MSRPSTPSQTVGPFLAIGLTWPGGDRVVPVGTPGAFWLRGQVLDGDGQPVPDGMVETWQVDQVAARDGTDAPTPAPVPGSVAGSSSGFRGFGRSLTATDGSFAIHTVKPARVPDGNGGWQAPHLDVSVFARGLLARVVTRVYFADENDANAADDVLGSLPAARRATLIARQSDDGYRLDIVLRGPDESVFFAL
jgi:protocatechuate 3,4-dioxygenase alpha subunit